MVKRFLSVVLVLGGLAASAADMPTRLDVTAQPEGAQVFVDGTLRGTAPCSVFGLAPGAHLVHLEAPSCQPADAFVSLAEGEFVQRSYALAEEKALILVKTTPPGAEVRENGVSLGVTPLLVTTLASGRTHTLDLSLNGYQPRRIDVRAEGRVPLVREERLALDSGVVDCTSEPSGAIVTVNGVERGITPLQLMNVPKGLATLSLRLSGYQDETRELRIVPGGRQTLALTLKPRPARLTVVSSPEQARVFVDDNYQGKSPVTVASLAPGAHDIRVELPGHAPLVRTVTLANGAEATEEFRMENVLGRLEVVTTPPGAKISLDGKAVGTTRSQGDAARSQVLALEGVAAGEHAVLARLDGYQDESRRVTVKAKGTSPLFIRMKRVFAADTEVETIRGTYRGVLVENGPLGLVLETAPGVQQTFQPSDIRKVRPLVR